MDENRHFSDYLDPSLIQTDNGIFLSWKLLFAFVFLMVIVFLSGIFHQAKEEDIYIFILIILFIN